MDSFDHGNKFLFYQYVIYYTDESPREDGRGVVVRRKFDFYYP